MNVFGTGIGFCKYNNSEPDILLVLLNFLINKVSTLIKKVHLPFSVNVEQRSPTPRPSSPDSPGRRFSLYVGPGQLGQRSLILAPSLQPNSANLEMHPDGQRPIISPSSVGACPSDDSEWVTDDDYEDEDIERALTNDDYEDEDIEPALTKAEQEEIDRQNMAYAEALKSQARNQERIKAIWKGAGIAFEYSENGSLRCAGRPAGLDLSFSFDG